MFDQSRPDHEVTMSQSTRRSIRQFAACHTPGNLMKLLRETEREEAEAFGAGLFEEAIQRIKVGEFSTLRELGKAFGKTARWAERLCRVIRGHGRMTAIEMKLAMRPKAPANPLPTPMLFTRWRQRHRQTLRREHFEAVFRTKEDAGLSLELVVKLLRRQCWPDQVSFAEHFKQKPWWVGKFGEFLIRERWLTRAEWRECWPKWASRRRRTHAA